MTTGRNVVGELDRRVVGVARGASEELRFSLPRPAGCRLCGAPPGDWATLEMRELDDGPALTALCRACDPSRSALDLLLGADTERFGLLVLSNVRACEAGAADWDRGVGAVVDRAVAWEATGWRVSAIVLLGDLTATGAFGDFTELHRRVTNLRRGIARSGHPVAVVAVPGGADATKSVGASIVAREWAGDEAAASAECRDVPGGDVERQLATAFERYAAWLRDAQAGHGAPATTPGRVPGDARVVLRGRRCDLTLLCVNTAVQSAGGQRPPEVAMDPWRIDALLQPALPPGAALVLCGEPPDRFIPRHRARLAAAMRAAGVGALLSPAGGSCEVSAPSADSLFVMGGGGDEPGPSQCASLVRVEVGLGAAGVAGRVVARAGVGLRRVEPETREEGEERVRKALLAAFPGKEGASLIARRLLRQGADIDDFAHDHFPAVHKRFWASMPYSAAITLLLENVPEQTLKNVLIRAFPSVAARLLASGERP